MVAQRETYQQMFFLTDSKLLCIIVSSNKGFWTFCLGQRQEECTVCNLHQSLWVSNTYAIFKQCLSYPDSEIIFLLFLYKGTIGVPPQSQQVLPRPIMPYRCALQRWSRSVRNLCPHRYGLEPTIQR